MKNDQTTIMMTQREFDELKTMVQRIETALCGDPPKGITGIVTKVNRHEKQLNHIQRILWIGIGAGSIIAIFWKIFTEVHK